MIGEMIGIFSLFTAVHLISFHCSFLTSFLMIMFIWLIIHVNACRKCQFYIPPVSDTIMILWYSSCWRSKSSLLHIISSPVNSCHHWMFGMNPNDSVLWLITDLVDWSPLAISMTIDVWHVHRISRTSICSVDHQCRHLAYIHARWLLNIHGQAQPTLSIMWISLRVSDLNIVITQLIIYLAKSIRIAHNP